MGVRPEAPLAARNLPGRPGGETEELRGPTSTSCALMILPQVHLRKPCYDFYFL